MVFVLTFGHQLVGQRVTVLHQTSGRSVVPSKSLGLRPLQEVLTL